MTAPSTQVTTLLTQFGLTTAAEELVPRLTQAGHSEAMAVLLEVFEAEAEARRQRRVARLRRAARLPPGKTFATLDTGRLPAPVVQQLETLATGAFLETATNVLAFGLPGVGNLSCKNAFPKSRGSADVPETATEDPRRGSEPRTTTERQRLEAQPGRPGGQAPGTTGRVPTTEPEAERPSLLLVARVRNRPTATRNAGRVDPTIRTGTVGDGTPTGTRSREAGSVPGRPETVLDELPNPILRKGQPKGPGPRG